MQGNYLNTRNIIKKLPEYMQRYNMFYFVFKRGVKTQN